MTTSFQQETEDGFAFGASTNQLESTSSQIALIENPTIEIIDSEPTDDPFFPSIRRDVHFSLVTAHSPATITKTFSLDADGKLVKTTVANVYAGHVKSMIIKSLAACRT